MLQTGMALLAQNGGNEGSTDTILDSSRRCCDRWHRDVAFGVGGIPIARRYLERWSQSAETTARDVKGQVQAHADTEGHVAPSPIPEPPADTPHPQ